MKRSGIHALFIAVFLPLFLPVASGRLAAQDESLPKVRVVHAVPDAPAFDLYLDEITPAIFQGIRYGDASATFQLQPGLHTAAVTAAGAPKETALLTQQADANLDSAYTIIATGQVQALDVAPVVLTRYLKRVPTSGATLIRLMNASRPAGGIDIKVTDIASNTTTIGNLGFRTAGDYFSVPSGNIRVEVSRPGGEVFYTGTGSVTQGGLLTLIAVGDPDAGSFRVYVLPDNSDQAKAPMDTLRVEQTGTKGYWRLIHASANAGRLETQVDTKTLTLGYRDATDVSDDFDAGNYNVKVRHEEGTPGSPLIDKDVEVIANAYRATYIIGDENAGTLDLISLTADVTARPPAGQAGLRVLNVSLDTALVDIKIRFSDGSTRDVRSSGFRNFTQYAPGPAGSTTVTLTRPGESVPFLTVQGMIPADAFSTLVILGDVNNGGHSVSLLVDSRESAQMPMLEFQKVSSVTGVEGIVEDFRIYQDRNSASPRVQFSLSVPADISIRLFDVRGGLVRSDDLGFRGKGEHLYVPAVGDLASGFYIAVLISEGKVLGRERLVVRN